MRDFSPKATYLSLTAAELTPADLDRISAARRLTTVWLQRCRLRDGAQLRKLNDSDLACLKDCTRMQTLSITDSDITDVGLRHLAKLKKLELLNLNSSRIEGHGFAQLASLPKLATVWLSGSQLSDDQLRFLQALPKLTTLLMHDTPVTPEGVLSLSTTPFLHVSPGGSLRTGTVRELQRRQALHLIGGATAEEELTRLLLDRTTRFMRRITQVEEQLQRLEEADASAEARRSCLEEFNAIFDAFCDPRTPRRHTPSGSRYAFFSYTNCEPLVLHLTTRSKAYVYCAEDRLFRVEWVRRKGVWRLWRRQNLDEQRWRTADL